MKKIKDNKTIDLKNIDEKEKSLKLGNLSKQINKIFEETKG